MTDVMNAILERVLSQELARQTVWQEEDVKNFGYEEGNREYVIAEIKKFMEENEIRFREDFYFDTMSEMKED